ncbi:MAG: hypothetical protein U9R34_00055 [Nanoarchaeota archaeon]|nr:hypothetical protein [Nanoarchaeota archaeon]
MANIRDSARKLSKTFEQIFRKKIPLEKCNKSKSLISFRARQSEYLKENFFTALRQFRKDIEGLDQSQEALELKSLTCEIKGSNLEKINKTINRINQLAGSVICTGKVVKLQSNNIPEAIASEIKAEIHEVEACFNYELYRSAVILCGRILETALHRKYYEAVGVDLLEKSPGIGLGKIIAKLSEKNISLDPGLTQQIHLINQVRIFTVHKKQKAFYPSRSQAHATILYTIDVLDKLF